MGGRVCLVCASRSTADITKEIADGTMSFTEIASRFGVSRNSVARHSKNCLHIRRIEKEAAAPVERTEVTQSSRIDPHDPQALLAAQAQLVNQALDVAEHAADHRTQLAAIREARDGLTVLDAHRRNAPSRRRCRDRCAPSDADRKRVRAIGRGPESVSTRHHRSGAGSVLVATSGNLVLAHHRGNISALHEFQQRSLDETGVRDVQPLAFQGGSASSTRAAVSKPIIACRRA